MSALISCQFIFYALKIRIPNCPYLEMNDEKPHFKFAGIAKCLLVTAKSDQTFSFFMLLLIFISAKSFYGILWLSNFARYAREHSRINGITNESDSSAFECKLCIARHLETARDKRTISGKRPRTKTIFNFHVLFFSNLWQKQEQRVCEIKNCAISRNRNSSYRKLTRRSKKANK